MNRGTPLALVVLLSAGLLLSGCALFADAARPRGQDGLPGQLPIEPEGAYLEASCSGYRDTAGEVFYYRYQFSSSLVARNRLCPLSGNPGGDWRTSEDVSINEDTDTVRLSAELNSHSYQTARSWPVPPTLIVYCWDLTETSPGDLGVGLYHYGPPHDFEGSFRVRLRFNDGSSLWTDWLASSLEAEAIFLPTSDIGSFISELEETSEDTGYALEVEVAAGTSGESRLSFDMSGWEKAVKPLLEECGVTL